MHVPAATSETVRPLVPPTVHTSGVVEVTVTGKFDDALAITWKSDVYRLRSAIGANVMT